jgi:hypothetical protein
MSEPKPHHRRAAAEALLDGVTLSARDIERLESWYESGDLACVRGAFPGYVVSNLTRTAQAIADAEERGRAQWQPIATAPRKGTREQPHITLATADRPADTFTGSWCEFNECWVDHRGRSDDDYDRTYHPTHWMPIPPVPARAALEPKP